MSLPLPRRIAQAALLIGAAAAPLIGAGAAQAAAQPQQGLGGLSSLDTGSLGNADLGGTVKSTSHQATTLAGQAGTEALRAADRVGGTVGTTGVPAVQRAAGQAAESAGQVSGATAESAGGAVPTDTLPTSALPNAGALPLSGALPTSGLLTDELPLL